MDHIGGIEMRKIKIGKPLPQSITGSGIIPVLKNVLRANRRPITRGGLINVFPTSASEAQNPQKVKKEKS